jgi:ketosteroid isomerase-like protein
MNTIAAPRIEHFLSFYNGLSSQNMQQLADVYHPDVVFIDPVHEIHGRNALHQYFNHVYARLRHCEFAGQDKMERGEQGFFSWQMRFTHPAIGNGKMIVVAGCSVLRWQDGLVVYHRDYYDLDEMVYQHLPCLGWVTGKIKQRMANS